MPLCSRSCAPATSVPSLTTEQEKDPVNTTLGEVDGLYHHYYGLGRRETGVQRGAADRGCSITEATAWTVELHNQLVRDFEAGHKTLLAVPSAELHGFLKGTKAWMGGGFERRTTHPRYR